MKLNGIKVSLHRYFVLVEVFKRMENKDYDSLSIYTNSEKNYSTIVWRPYRDKSYARCFIEYSDHTLVLELYDYMIEWWNHFETEKFLAMIQDGKVKSSKNRIHFKKVYKLEYNRENKNTWFQKGLQKVETFLDSIRIESDAEFREQILFFLCSEFIFANKRNSILDNNVLVEYFAEVIQNSKQAKNYTFEEMKKSQYKLDVKLEENESQRKFDAEFDKLLDIQTEAVVPFRIFIENKSHFGIGSFTLKLSDTLDRKILSKRGLVGSLSNSLLFTPRKRKHKGQFICPHSLEMNLWEGYTYIHFYISETEAKNLELEYEIQTEENLFFKGTVIMIFK